MSLPHPYLNYPNDYSLREQGALEFTAEKFHFANSSVGIIWKVFDGTNTSYIPQVSFICHILCSSTVSTEPCPIYILHSNTSQSLRINFWKITCILANKLMASL